MDNIKSNLEYDYLKYNLEEVNVNINNAYEKSEKLVDKVTLVAVSKTKPYKDIEALFSFGQKEFGENKVQELVEKLESNNDEIKWHFIGHLQRNKVKYIIGKTKLIHSVDSVKLAAQIEKEAEKLNEKIDILLEVNIAKEESKYGFLKEDIDSAVKDILKFNHINIRGLMTVAPYTDDKESNRTYFKELRLLKEELNNNNRSLNMDQLSMGMTNDYEIAIEEGATIIRVGTGLFGKRDYSK